MPLFPEIDLSGFVQNAGENGLTGMPVADPNGVMQGLNASLLHLLANFSPGDLGVCVVDNKLQLSLNLDRWAEWAWYVDLDLTIAIGSGALVTLFTVPTDERCQLDSVQVLRTSGDNVFNRLRATQPAGYGEGDRILEFIRLSTAGSGIFWPDPGNDQALTTISNVSPLWLEPGATIDLTPTGAGSAETLATVRMAMRRTKLVRNMVP